MTKTTKEKLDEAYTQFLSEDFDTDDVIGGYGDVVDAKGAINPNAQPTSNPVTTDDIQTVQNWVNNDADAQENSEPNAYQGDPNQKPGLGDNTASKFSQFKQAIMDSAFMQQPWVKQFLATYDGAKDAVATHPGYAVAGVLGGIIGAYGIYKLVQMYKAYKATSNTPVMPAEEVAKSTEVIETSKDDECPECNKIAQEASNTLIDVTKISKSLKACSENQKYATITRINNMIQESISYHLTEGEIWDSAKKGAKIGGLTGLGTGTIFGGMVADDDRENGILGINPPNRVSPFIVDPSANPIFKIANGSIVGGIAGALGGMTIGAAYGIVKKFFNSIGKHDPEIESAPVAEADESQLKDLVSPEFKDKLNHFTSQVGKNTGDLLTIGKNAIKDAETEFYKSQNFFDADSKIKWIEANPDKAAAVGIPLVLVAGALLKVAYNKWKEHKASQEA